MHDVLTLQLARLALVLAQDDSVSRMPTGKAIAGIGFFGVVGVGSLIGIFASNATLESYSSVIGSKNPLVARALCVLGAVVGLGGAALFGMHLAGVL
jgi:hypothetical protein